MMNSQDEPATISIEPHQLEIPFFKFKREIGSGANGTVYEAIDTALGRAIALKVWNVRGRSKAQFEAAKVAGVSHPLIVTTHTFGLVNGYPYAVMELVPGVSGKEWMRSIPAVEARVGVWRMYSRALRHMHSTGIIHGDPHLGNLIVFADESEALAPRNWRGEPSTAMKLADAGTSEFWADHDDFSTREARLIHETAGRIFQAERFNALADRLDGLGYAKMLTACDAVVECISTLNGLPDYNRRSQVAGRVVDIVIDTPVFNLDELHQQTSACDVTAMHRVITRLNGVLTGLNKRDWDKGTGEITHETRSLYYKLRNEWRS